LPPSENEQRAKHVVPEMECLRTRVRFPPPPPSLGTAKGRFRGPLLLCAPGGRADGPRQPDSGTSVISTRRFWARPDSVSLLAIGRVSPAPIVIMRSRMTPRVER